MEQDETPPDPEITLASTVRLLALAIRHDEPAHLLTARRLLQSLDRHPGLSGMATATAVRSASEMLTACLETYMGGGTRPCTGGESSGALH